MKKYCAYLLILCYIFTAQLTVHDFAMHGGSTSEQSTMTPCGHSSDTNEHTKNMTMCLEQSMGAFVGYTPTLLATIHTPLVFTSHIYFQSPTQLEESTNFFHDPGWNYNHGSFSHYRKQLYGHGIVMHC